MPSDLMTILETIQELGQRRDAANIARTELQKEQDEIRDGVSAQAKELAQFILGFHLEFRRQFYEHLERDIGESKPKRVAL